MPFTLPPLPYAYDALEPFIDTQTMQIHHDKHHAAYVTNLNKALEPFPDLQSKTLEQLLSSLDSLPDAIRNAVRNNAGGHWNHSYFWPILKVNGGAAPSGDLGRSHQLRLRFLRRLQDKICRRGRGKIRLRLGLAALQGRKTRN